MKEMRTAGAGRSLQRSLSLTDDTARAEFHGAFKQARQAA
jgi:hypothetical protein